MIIAAKPKEISASQKDLFEFLSDFRNYEQLMPDQIVNWSAEKELCSFTISGMIDLSLKFSKKEPYNRIDIVPEGKTPIHFTLSIFLDKNVSQEKMTSAKVEIDASLNPMMAMMAKKPLENLVQIISEKLGEKF